MKLQSQTFPSGKQYACIQDGNTCIFLRNIAFLHAPRNPEKIAVVREWGSTTNKGVWEPPKGQMEWKEFSDGFRRGQRITAPQFVAAAKRGILRELEEEAKILPSDIQDFHPLPLHYIEPFPEAPHQPAFFRYQFWTGALPQKGMDAAQRRMRALVSNPQSWASLPDDKKEKDAVEWWAPPAWEKIRGAFSGKMTRMYYRSS